MLTYADVKIDDVTPMMQQYLLTKKEYMDCILLYRLGDFYEMFFDDAVKASEILDLALTGKSCGLEERAPMCGIPFHAVDSYLDKIIEAGEKAAICEQTEDPKLAKGLVKREVIRIVTPGTSVNPQTLEESRNNFLMSIVDNGNILGISYADISTGEFYVTETDTKRRLQDEIAKVSPSEIICTVFCKFFYNIVKGFL